MLSIQNYQTRTNSYKTSFKAIKPKIKSYDITKQEKSIGKKVSIVSLCALALAKIFKIFHAESDAKPHFNNSEKDALHLLKSFEEHPYQDFTEDDIDAFNSCRNLY